MQYENAQQLQRAVQNGELPANRLYIGYQGTVVELAVEVWHAGECIFRLSRPTETSEAGRPKQAAGRLASKVRSEIGAVRRALLDTDIPARKGYYRNGHLRRGKVTDQ